MTAVEGRRWESEWQSVCRPPAARLKFVFTDFRWELKGRLRVRASTDLEIVTPRYR